MKKGGFFLLFLFHFIILSAQNNNLSKKILFSLENNEKLLMKNFVSSVNNKKNHFAAITYNYETQKFSFILDSNRITKFNYDIATGYIPFNFFHLDLNNFNYGYILDENKKIYVVINGKKIETSSLPINIIIKKNGKFSLLYKNNDMFIININEKVIGQFYKINDIEYSESGKYIFNYYDKEKNAWFVNINGTANGPYKKVMGVDIANSGDFAFYFQDFDDSYNVNINGKKIGPFQSTAYFISINSFNKFAYAYRSADKWFVNHNNSIVSKYSGASYIENVYLSEADDFAIKYKQNLNTICSINEENVSLDYFNNFINNQPKCPFSLNQPEDIVLTSNNETHKFVSNIQNNSVEVNGKRYGSAFATSAYYNEINNSFVWNSLENNKLITYELKIF